MYSRKKDRMHGGSSTKQVVSAQGKTEEWVLRQLTLIDEGKSGATITVMLEGLESLSLPRLYFSARGWKIRRKSKARQTNLERGGEMV